MSTMMLDGNANPIQSMRPKSGATQTLSIGASAQTLSTAFPGKVGLRIHADAACFIEFGKDPSATTSSMPMPEGTIEYFYANPGDKISVIQKDGGSGALYITEMT